MIELDYDYWITKDNRWLYPKDMETSHLKNCLKFMDRNADRLHDIAFSEALITSGTVGGEWASYHSDKYLMHLGNQDPVDYVRGTKIYKLMEEEWDKRSQKPQCVNPFRLPGTYLGCPKGNNGNTINKCGDCDWYQVKVNGRGGINYEKL